ncbi:MAG: hypothetical protein EBS49_00575 [Verrucomicrobia bacterium]|nr:hypothetical protein [Verrucomicrobiota bacterium]
MPTGIFPIPPERMNLPWDGPSLPRSITTASGAPTIYYGDEIGMTGAQDPDNRRMFPDPAKLTLAEKSVQDHVSRLNALRTKHPAIRYGSRRAIQADQATYAVARAYLQDRVLVLYNRSESPAKLDLELGPEFVDGTLEDRLGKLGKFPVKNGKLSITLPALTSALLIP